VSAVLADLGVETGDRVATLAWNTQAHVEAWYAVLGMGAVCHTLNPRLTEAQLAAMTIQSQARVLIASADLAPLARRVAARTPSLERVLLIDGPAEPDALEGLLAEATASVSWGDFPETAPSGLCFTSGTTGAPKGVTYTHRSSYLHTLRLLQADVMAISARDTVLAAVPMFHANAWGLPFAAPAAGARLVLPGRALDGASLARLINEEAVTLAVGIATVWLGLIEHLETHGGETPSLRRVIVGGAPLAPALMERIEARLGVMVQTSWGMTELSPLGTCAPPDDPARSAQDSGRIAVGMDLLLTDADGRALPDQRGAEGHLHVRGAAVLERYFGETESATDADGWFPTGDLARIAADGALTITGRAKDLIKSGGEWINPAEIEAVINELPDVSLAAVIGRPDAKWGERPLLIVQTRESSDISDEALLAPLHGRVASWWIPDEVVRLAQMPLASTGKIDKMRLRVEHAGT
jgi:fatty-acyl-CoA synthase